MTRKEKGGTTWVSVCVSFPFNPSALWLSWSVPPISWAFVWPVCLSGYKNVWTNMKSRCDEQCGTFHFHSIISVVAPIHVTKVPEKNNMWISNHRKRQDVTSCPSDSLLCSACRTRGGHCVEIVHKLSSHFFWFESKLSTADDPDASTKGDYLKRTNMIQLALMCKSRNGRVIFPTRNKWVMNRKEEKKTVVISVLALPKQPATARDSGVFSPTLVDAD